MYEYQPMYIAPRGKGRPPQRTDKELPIANFWQGVNTYFDSTRIEGECRMAFNNRCYEGATLDRRLGFDLLGVEGDAGKVYCQMVLQQVDDTDIHLRIVEGAGAGVQVQKWSGSAWGDLGSNIGTADDRVDWDWTYIQIAGEDRVYFTNGVSELRYTAGTVISTVADTKAKYIATKENILILGCMKDIYAENQFVWAKKGSHQFHQDSVEDYSTSSYVSAVDGPITGLKVFNWQVYTFTGSDGLFETDITSIAEPRKISDQGTLCPKSIATGFDIMVWANQHGVWQLPIGGNILKISKSLDNIYSELAFGTFYEITGGMTADQQYELHVGNMTYEGDALTKVVFVYEIEQSRFYNNNIWRVDTDKIFANNMVSVADQYGFFETYYGSRDTQTVWEANVGAYDEEDREITLTWISKDFPLMSENNELTATDLYLRYTPNGAEQLPLSVYIRKDTESWQLVGNFNLPAGSGAIELERIQMIKGVTGRTLAVKLVSLSSLPISVKQVLLTYSHNESQLTPLVPIAP